MDYTIGNINDNGKRKNPRYSVDEKLECVKRMEDGEEITSLSREFGPAVGTLKKWMKEKEKLVLSASVSAARLMMHNSSEIYNALYRWFDHRRLRELPVLKEEFQCKAAELHMTSGIEGFEPSDKWLSTCLEISSMEFVPGTIKKIPIDQVSHEKFHQELLTTFRTTNLRKCQVFNCSEISWNYKSLPGFPKLDSNLAEDYVKVLSITNADRSLKLPLIITRLPGETKWWKNEHNIPLYSVENNETHINTVVLAHWFKQSFVPQVTKFLNIERLAPKALLILDTDRFQLINLKIGEIRCMLSPNYQSFLVSHFDDCLMDLMKSCKKKFLKKLSALFAKNPNSSLVELLAEINVENLLQWIFLYWQKTIGGEYVELMGPVEVIHSIRGFENIKEEVVTEWMKECEEIDFPSPPNVELNVARNVELDVARNVELDVARNVEKGPADSTGCSLTALDTANCLNVAIEYFSHHKSLAPYEMFVLKKALQVALKN